MQDDQLERAEQARQETLDQTKSAGNENDVSTGETLQQEQLIDPGNEHNHPEHPVDAPLEDVERPSGRNAKTEDSTSTAGPEPGEGENDDPDLSGEAG